MTLSEELQWRGFVNQTTLSDITDLDKTKRTFYLGVDPSASSMTIGNLAVMMMVRLFAVHGHKAILLVGGATGMIGDPDGKKQERDLLTLEQIASNKKAIAAQYKQILGEVPFELVDNYDWFKDMGYLQFLREVGKHVPMRTMLGRDFVQSRLGEDGTGISYAEFSYSLIQGFDFVHLFRERSCTLQICGADQWGNSITGVDLLRRIEGAEAHVWSAPLVVNKTTGVKFGKSEDGAVWLDSDLTSVYKFYQFWLNVDDEGVGDYLKIYTLLNKDEHDKVMTEFESNRGARHAQKTLAYEVTKLVHGKDSADSVVRITAVLFGGADIGTITPKDLQQLTSELPSGSVKVGDTIVQVLVDSGLASSSSEARRFAEQGGVSVNGEKVAADFVFSKSDGKASGAALIKRGKNNFAVATLA
jgi:tyrosyl-tRNA synthetase